MSATYSRETRTAAANFSDYSPEFVEAVSRLRSIEFFRIQPERALAGEGLSSAEADPSQDSSLAIVNLLNEQPERFHQLIGYLPPLIQDIFLQYFILRRTQYQIAETLSITQSGTEGRGVSQGLRLGMEAICAIIAWGPDPNKMNGHAAAASYRLLLAQKTKPASTRKLNVKVPANLGSFEISAKDHNLEEFFVFKWHQGTTGN